MGEIILGKGFSDGSVVKNLPTTQEMQVQSLGREDTLEKEMATHSSLLAWKIPWTKSLVGGTPRSHKELDRTERLSTQIHSRQEQHTIHVGSFIHCYPWKRP